MEDSFKTPRIRSAAYPSYTLQHCIHLTETIYKLFGNSVHIPREKISEKTSISYGHLQTQLSSAGYYDLLDSRKNEGYKPSARFLQLYRPKPDENLRELKIEAFKQPDLYAKIIREHNNKQLTVDGLATLLVRDYRIAENACEAAAGIFIENAKELSLINADNFFSIDAEAAELNGGTDAIEVINPVSEPTIITEGKDQVKYLPPANQSVDNRTSFNYPPIPIFVDDEGAVAEVYLPKGFNKEHIKRVIKVLAAQID